jgi:FkbM family methyltransferase
MIVIDIGANIGAHTILMSKLVGDKGKVYAFEPFSINYNSLFCSLLLNGCHNTTIYKYGVGKDKHKMYVNKRWFDTKIENNFGAITLQEESQNTQDEEVEIVNLDSFEFKKVDLIKIDAEGMEDKVIQGMEKLISDCRPYLIVEIHDPDVPKIVKLFSSINYEIMNIYDNITNYRTLDYFAYPKEKEQLLLTLLSSP